MDLLYPRNAKITTISRPTGTAAAGNPIDPLLDYPVSGGEEDGTAWNGNADAFGQQRSVRVFNPGTESTKVQQITVTIPAIKISADTEGKGQLFEPLVGDVITVTYPTASGQANTWTVDNVDHVLTDRIGPQGYILTIRGK